MDIVIKINCVFNLSMILTSFYFIARARFNEEIKKHIHNHFNLISVGISLGGVLSWYAFYYNCKMLLFDDFSCISTSLKHIIIIQLIINVSINILIWYLFSKIKRNV